MNKKLFEKPVFAMLQPPALPGTYTNELDIEKIIEISLNEAKMINDNNFDGIIIQNMNDMQIKQFSNMQTVAYMTRISLEIKKNFPNLIIGILVNWDGVASLSVADAINADFIRVEHCYTGAEVTSAGILEAQCCEILNLKRKINSKIPIFADIYEIHGVAIGKKSYKDNAFETIYEAFADGIFVSGKTTKESIEIVKEIREKLPNTLIYLGGGATGDNIKELMQYYDGVSVATWIKDGNMRNPINPKKAEIFIKNAKNIIS